jgi:hypothetical protein
MTTMKETTKGELKFSISGNSLNTKQLITADIHFVVAGFPATDGMKQ